MSAIDTIKYVFHGDYGILTRDRSLSDVLQEYAALLMADLQSGLYESAAPVLAPAYDTAMQRHIVNQVREFLNIPPRLMVVIGVGGAVNATRGILHVLAPLLKIDMQWRILDSIDMHTVSLVEQQMVDVYQQGGRVALVIVSLSGDTIETQLLATRCLALAMRYCGAGYVGDVVVITYRDSPLYAYASAHSYMVYEVPSSIGGRFSVFSSVSLVPFAIMGGDPLEICEGARAALQSYADMKSFPCNSALQAAAYYRYNITEQLSFFWSDQLYALGGWWQQLMAESIGKRNNTTGVPVGIVPTTALGTRDLHSLYQLYLDGPSTRFATFVDVGCDAVSSDELTVVRSTIYRAVCAHYDEQEIPYATVSLSVISPYVLGQFLQMKILEVLYIAYLLDVNPYTQPGVHAYKKRARGSISISSLW